MQKTADGESHWMTPLCVHLKRATRSVPRSAEERHAPGYEVT